MRTHRHHLTPALTAALAAAAILVAPAVGAAPTPRPDNCSDSGGTTTCVSPGNVEIRTQTSGPSMNAGPYHVWPPRTGDRAYHPNTQHHRHHRPGQR